MIAHYPEASCHRTLRRPFGKRGVWNFDVPRTDALKREQHREALKREMQRQVVHTRWAARRVYEHVQFEGIEVRGLAPRMTMTRKRPHEDVLYLLHDKNWLTTEFRKLGVDEILMPYATRLLHRLCGVVPGIAA